MLSGPYFACCAFALLCLGTPDKSRFASHQLILAAMPSPASALGDLTLHPNCSTALFMQAVVLETHDSRLQRSTLQIMLLPAAL